MAEPLHELTRRLERIEQLLSRKQGHAGGAGAGPEVRSARTIVSRLDDVWVAVTEGNDRIGAGLEQLRTDLVDRPDPPPAPPVGAAGEDDGAEPALHLRLNRIEEALAGIAGRVDALAPPAPPVPSPPGSRGAAEVETAIATTEERLLAELDRLSGRIDALAAAVGEPAAGAGAGDDTLADRLGRLRHHLRR